MNNYPLIGGSICAIVLIVLASLTNVVGYQIVQTSNQKIMTSGINEKELLFRAICDIANNKEVQKVILESQGNKFPMPFLKTPLPSLPVFTKKHFNAMYNLGMFLSKTMSKAQVVSLLKKHPINVHFKEKVSSVIKNNAKISEATKQLSLLDCNCSETNDEWTYPVICLVLNTLFLGVYGIALFFMFLTYICSLLIPQLAIQFGIIMLVIFGISAFIKIWAEELFNCTFWVPPIPSG